MISSIPNFFCCITKPCRNKVIMKNESNYAIKYEAYIYRGASIGKIDTAIGAGGFNGKTALEIIQGEGLKPESGRIAKNATVHVTCGYGGKIAIRYYMIGLHTDYTDELRNFQVLDVVKFIQPYPEEIEIIINKNKEEQEEKERKRKEEQEEKERKRKEEQEEKERLREEKKEQLEYSRRVYAERVKQETSAAEREAEREAKERKEAEDIRRKCSSLSKFMCSAADTPKKRCPYCGEWYCNYHYDVNNNRVGTGGHVCGK